MAFMHTQGGVVLDIDTGILHLPDDELPRFPCTALLSAKLEALAKVILCEMAIAR